MQVLYFTHFWVAMSFISEGVPIRFKNVNGCVGRKVNSRSHCGKGDGDGGTGAGGGGGGGTVSFVRDSDVDGMSALQ
jgi:hypothetical protein